MTNVVAIDPGVHACAWARFYRFATGWTLVETGFATAPYMPDFQCEVGEIVVERPDYQGDRSNRARTQDLLGLSWAGAACAFYVAGATGAPVVEYTPRQWKGSEAKPVQHARLFGVNSHLTGEPAVLTPAEQAVLGGHATAAAIAAAVEKGAADRWAKPGVAYYLRTFATHNLLDAAALGCFHLGRLEKR